MIGYKLTDQKNQTHDGCQWGENITHEITKPGATLCTDEVIHFYAHPGLAVFMNSHHANIYNPRLWECEVENVVANDYTKSGCKKLTTLKRLPVPKLSTEQRIEIAIRIARLVYFEEKWTKWADDWITGEDRSATSAYTAAAYSAAAYYAAHAAYSAAAYSHAAYYAAHAAYYAAHAAYAASVSSAVAYYAAYAAYAAYVSSNFGEQIIAIIDKVMNKES